MLFEQLLNIQHKKGGRLRGEVRHVFDKTQPIAFLRNLDYYNYYYYCYYHYYYYYYYYHYYHYYIISIKRLLTSLRQRCSAGPSIQIGRGCPTCTKFNGLFTFHFLGFNSHKLFTFYFLGFNSPKLITFY